MVVKVNESYSSPCEGYFWYINGEVVGVKSEVSPQNYVYSLSGQTHEKYWNKIKSQYLVDRHEVKYDYYPRGRVMVDPETDSQGVFKGYTCQVFMDMCLDSQEVKDKVVDFYNLYCIKDIDWFVSEKFSLMNHYTCHNCRK